jgi:hypothetical protein
MVDGLQNCIAMRYELLTEGKGQENPIPYDAIGPFTDDIQQLVVSANGKAAYAGVCDVFHVEGTKGGTETIRRCPGTFPSPRLAYYYSSATATRTRRYSVFCSALFCSALQHVPCVHTGSNAELQSPPCECIVLKFP